MEHPTRLLIRIKNDLAANQRKIRIKIVSVHPVCHTKFKIPNIPKSIKHTSKLLISMKSDPSGNRRPIHIKIVFVHPVQHTKLKIPNDIYTEHPTQSLISLHRSKEFKSTSKNL